MTDKKRSFTRSSVHVDVDVHVDGRRLSTGEISDISLGGMYVPCSEQPDVGTQCDVALHVGGRETGVRIRALGTVARAADGGLGVAFEEIRGTDSLHHLRQLVLLNSQSPDQTEHEFTTHLGIKDPPEASKSQSETSASGSEV